MYDFHCRPGPGPPQPLLVGAGQVPLGRIEIDGRVAALLEVGTGFHGELTGRENIYMNGTILGMKRAEITRKFDEIVAFAEVEQFIDTLLTIKANLAKMK